MGPTTTPTAPTIAHGAKQLTKRAQHPRMNSSSSTMSSTSTSFSSCSMSPSPKTTKSNTISTKSSAAAKKKRSSWMLSRHDKPGWEDTTVTPYKDHSQHSQHNRTHQYHQRADSYDQAMLPLTSPHSPPSSPLPISLHKQNKAASTLIQSSFDIDSDDEQPLLCKQYTSRAQKLSSVTKNDYKSSEHSDSLSSPQEVKVSRELAARPRGREGNSVRTTTVANIKNDISSRPRFTVSIAISPRPQTYSVGAAARDCPKEPPNKSSTAIKSSRNVKESTIPRMARSTPSNLGHAQSTIKSVSTSRVLKSATITTTTTTTTRRVASTTITMAPSASHHDREKHRRLAITADTSSNGAISVKTPSSKREKATKASNLMTTGRAVRRVETHQSKAESTAELDNTSTTATKNNNNHVNNTNRADDRPKSSSFPNFKPTSTTVATLLPALQMEDEEELSAVSRHSQSAQDIATESRLKITSSPSRSPPLLPVALELSLQTINSPLVSSTHLESPRQSPFIPCSVLDDIQQDLNTSSEVTSNIPKGLTPPIQLPQETFANPSISMDRSYQATTIAKSSEIIPKSTSVVNIPSTFLSGTPLIFKAFRPAEVTTDPVPTTLHKNESTYPTSTSTSEGPVDLTLPTTQRNTPARTGLLASMGPNVSRTPLKRIKEPSVMLDMMMLVKERRASNSLCDATTFSNKNSVGTNNSSPVNVTQVSSAATANITFEDKKAYLKNQVAQRRNNRLKNRDLNKLDPLSIPDSSSGCFFQPSPLPSPASVDSLSVPAFPAVPVTIPLKAATVLHGMGYPINNAASIATSPFYPSRSSSPSPTWSAPSTPRMIPSSLSTTSLSSVSSISSSVSVVSSSSSWSSTSSSSKMSLPSSFPDRLFQTRSTSSSPVATLPRSFSPRTVRASSLTGVGERAGTLSSERQSCYIVQNSSNNNKPLFSAKLPSLPSPTLSLAVPERKFMSTRSIVDVDGYFRPRRQHFSGSRSEDEQPVASPTVGRYATLHPFEKEILQQQQQATEALHPSWSNDGSFKSSSVSPLVPSSCQDTSVGDKGMHRERVHERSMSATSIDFDKNGFLSQPHRHQKQQQQQQQQQHETYSQPSSPFLAAITTTSAAPTTQDISFLTKRLANLQLMDALCPVPVTPTTLNIATSTQHPSPQQQPSLQQSGAIDASWAMQIQLLLTHLAEQTDIEQECRPRPLPPPPRPASVILPQESNEEESDDRKNIRKKGMGLYKQVLTDWLFRLDQIATASLTATNSGLYRDHPGLKREIDKIRWQHNVPSRVVKTK